jgi:CubicO group peptidase (beta-lactamase class C family)
MGDTGVHDGPVSPSGPVPGRGPVAAAVRLVAEAVRERVTPAAVLAVGWGGSGARTGSYEIHTFGHTHPTAAAPPVTEETVFDLASLTKVVATTPAVLRLIDAGRLELDDPVARFLPEYAEGAKARVTLRHLLTHTSGLPAYEPFHELGASPTGLRATIAETPLIAQPASTVLYSDIGFMTLGFVLEAVTGTSLDSAVQDLVFTPLGLASTGYVPVHALGIDFAPTEPRPDTGEPRVGVVHDENAEALGGVAGHAGVFSTIGDLVSYLRQVWLSPESAESGVGFLSPELRDAATTCWTEHLNGRRGLGWTLARDRWDHMTAAWPDGRAGHTGFTGTSIAFDPDSGLWTVLLTNAAYHGRDRAGLALLRQTVHAAVAALAEPDIDAGTADTSADRPRHARTT